MVRGYGERKESFELCRRVKKKKKENREVQKRKQRKMKNIKLTQEIIYKCIKYNMNEIIIK